MLGIFQGVLHLLFLTAMRVGSHAGRRPCWLDITTIVLWIRKLKLRKLEYSRSLVMLCPIPSFLLDQAQHLITCPSYHKWRWLTYRFGKFREEFSSPWLGWRQESLCPVVLKESLLGRAGCTLWKRATSSWKERHGKSCFSSHQISYLDVTQGAEKLMMTGRHWRRQSRKRRSGPGILMFWNYWVVSPGELLP